MNSKSIHYAGIGLAIVLNLVASSYANEVPSLLPSTNTYGTASAIIHTLPAYAFELETSSITYGANTTGRYLTSAGGAFVAGLMLPSGARIESVKLEACDDSLTSVLGFELRMCPSPPTGSCTALATGSTVSLSGCGFVEVALAVPHTVDNATRVYGIGVVSGPETSANLRFASVRVMYRLQVTPAPFVARFDDVPTTHPFFQFIEALAAAGITGGCNATPPQYCPEAPITRGQMAVFLSRALGLHWAP